MAHKKGGSNTQYGRDSVGRRLGIKASGGSYVRPGTIIVRQRGTKFHPKDNVGMGKDHTIFALTGGKVDFSKQGKRRYVSILSR